MSLWVAKMRNVLNPSNCQLLQIDFLIWIKFEWFLWMILYRCMLVTFQLGWWSVLVEGAEHVRYVKEKCRFPERFLLQSRIEYALVAKSKFCETAFRKNERISESIVLHTFTYCKNSCSSHGGERKWNSIHFAYCACHRGVIFCHGSSPITVWRPQACAFSL